MPPARRLKAATRKLREIGSIASAVLSTGHPYMAHIVPMRRCNLACTYCNEFDDVSDRCRWTRCCAASITWDGLARR